MNSVIFFCLGKILGDINSQLIMSTDFVYNISTDFVNTMHIMRTCNNCGWFVDNDELFCLDCVTELVDNNNNDNDYCDCEDHCEACLSGESCDSCEDCEGCEDCQMKIDAVEKYFTGESECDEDSDSVS